MNKEQIPVFVLTFLAYASLHSIRSGWSFSKPQLEKEFDIDHSYFGLVDGCFLLSYSFGLGLLGSFNKKVPLNIFTAVGIIVAACCFMSFAVYYVMTKNYFFSLMIVVMCLNGFFQSTGWPGVIGIMGNWFGNEKKGLLMGFWAINSNIGNIIGQLTCNLLENNGVEWTYNFIILGCFGVVIGLLVLFFLRPKPATYTSIIQPLMQQQQVAEQGQANKSSQQNEEQLQVQRKSVNILTALLLPRVPFYIISYACMKGCIYGLLFWLPDYIQNKDPALGEQKGYIAAMVDVGAFTGGILIGYLSDKSNYRAIFMSPMTFVSSGLMFLVSFALTNVAWTYYLVLFGIGLTIGGPYNIIRTAITIDLAQQTGKKGNTATVSSLIEGSAAVFAAISQYIIAILPYEWIFYFFCGECLLSCVAIFPLFWQELTRWRKSKQKTAIEQVENSDQI